MRRDARAPLVIVDGDDTLWETTGLYQAAKTAIRSLITAHGLDAVRWTALQSAINVELTPSMRLGREQFPLSCVRALARLETEAGLPHDLALAEAVAGAARAVFTSTAPVDPAARRALLSMAKRARIVLLTKGDIAMQIERLREAGLSDAFEAVHILRDEKTPQLFSALCLAYGVRPENAWSVGNSLPSDIAPAARAGLQTVLLDARPTWAYEARAADCPPGAVVRRASTLQAALAIVSRAIAGRRVPERSLSA